MVSPILTEDKREKCGKGGAQFAKRGLPLTKFILIFIILFFAVGVAMALVARLSQTQQKLAELHRDLKRTDERLERQRLELERRQAEDDGKRGSS